MSITENEILKDYPRKDLTSEQLVNLEALLFKINWLRSEYKKPMTITSGFRSKEHHLRVYKELAEQRNKPFDVSKIPWGSAHLKCAAVDVLDLDGELYAWCLRYTVLLAEIGLWCEIKDDQPRVHFQIYAPASGNRFFYP